MTEKTCSICCERFTGHLRRPVECLHCHHICCRNCVGRYVLSTPAMPHCMACKKDWNRSFMYQSMTKTFVIETLKAHTEQLMIEREKALLPMTQPIVERTKHMRKLYDDIDTMYPSIHKKRVQEREALYHLRQCRNELIQNGLRLKQNELNMSETLTDSDQSDDERQDIRRHHARLPTILQEHIQTLRNIRKELKSIYSMRDANYIIVRRLERKNTLRIEALQRMYTPFQTANTRAAGGEAPIGNFDYHTSDSEDENEPSTSTSEPKQKRAKTSISVRSCPKEDCRGFLNSRWVCGLCNTVVCASCHQIKSAVNDKEHECDPNNVATAQLLMRDTKACPSCGVQIHKIDGCNMMFCTQCHTPFCWKTGAIIKNERIHNPHYYEWLRQNSKDGTIPREPGDEIGGVGGEGGDCQRRHIDMRTIRAALARYDLLSYDLEDILWSVHRMNVHIEMVEIPRFQNITMEDPIDLRVSYMLNEFNETKWKHQLYKRLKRVEKSTALGQIYEMIHVVLENEFRKLVTVPLTFTHILELLNTIETIRTYANEQFLEVSKLYQCSVPKIEKEHWRIHTQRAITTIRRPNKNDNANKDTEETKNTENVKDAGNVI